MTTSEITDRPWEALPAEVADVLRPEVPALADACVRAISEGVPGYARPLEGPFGEGVRRGVEVAIDRFLALIGEPGRDPREGGEVYRALGRGELLAGRSLDALQAAYRLGARVAWRRLGERGMAAGFAPATLHLLAEAIFAYIDELSAESVEGYAAAQAQQAGERDRRRLRLLELLLTADPDPERVEDSAAAAGWALPREVAVLALPAGADARRVAARIDPDALGGRVDERSAVLVPDPVAPGRDEAIARAAPAGAGLGPPVGVTHAARSLRWAEGALALGAGGGLARAEDRLALLAARADPELVALLAERVLAPLTGLTPASRRRLTATLLAWLRHQGHVPSIAADLHVHPQTVRYRIGRLRERFGDALDDPDSRFALTLVLHAQR